MGRGELGGGKERELRRQSVPSLRGEWVGRQTRCLVSSLLRRGLFVLLFLTQRELLCGVESPVSFLTKRGINSLKTGQSRLTNICITSSPADPQMRGNLNTRVPRAKGAFVRDGPSENSLIYFAETSDHAIPFLSMQKFDLYSLYIMNAFVVLCMM